MILAGGNIIDPLSQRIYKGDVFLKGQRIVDVSSMPSADHKVIDVSGEYVAPGLIDSHLHIESSWLSPTEFAKQAAVHGTTTVLVDPHEIANVAGRRGVDLFLDVAALLPLSMFIGIPSCVPATPLEDSGARLTIEDVQELVSDPRVYGLAEMMNVPGVIHGDTGARRKVALVYDYGKIVDGHCPGLAGQDLLRYVSNGENDGVVRIMSDHECTTAEEAIEKHKAGMYVALRYGTASKDLDGVLPSVLGGKIDLARFMLCSDDLGPAELYRDGHVDRIVKRARHIIMEHAGANLEQATTLALSLATVNPANYISRFLRFHNHPEIGAISVGSKADLVVFESLENLDVDKVIHDGRLVVDGGEYLGEDLDYDYSPLFSSVNLAERMEPSHFRVKYVGTRKKVRVKVIGAIEGSVETRLRKMRLSVDRGELSADPEADVVKIAVIERHRRTGSYAVGFVQGLGIKKGAIGSTVAHDSHNLIVAGADEAAMATAANHLADNGGGMVVVTGEGVEYCPLQIGGLMSTDRIQNVVNRSERLLEAARGTGSGLENMFMTLSFLSLPVIPELRITSKGLVDVGEFRLVTLYQE